MAKRRGIRKELAQLAPSGQTLEQQLKTLLEKKQYTKAIRKLQQSLKQDPGQSVSLTEADIWLQQGKDEFEQSRYSAAEQAFRQALSLGPAEQAHYWLAKALLEQQKTVEALALFQAAFDDKTLPKDLGGCYLKLLFLNGKTEVVESLISGKSSRFYAPHLHWARGVLALKGEDTESALSHFKKMGRPASPGDDTRVWQAYAHQCQGDWSKAELCLGLHQPWRRGMRSREAIHPALQRLILFHVTQGEHWEFMQEFEWQDTSLPQLRDVWVLELISLIRDEAFHSAAHLALAPPADIEQRYPEFQTLHRPLMVLGGNQAFEENSKGCAADFWETVVDQPHFDPNLALRLHQAFTATRAHRDDLNLLKKLLSWVQREAKRKPQEWPAAQLDNTQAQLYCWLADRQMVCGYYREANQSVQKATQLSPQHPDVIARQGLMAYSNHNLQTAIPLLTQSLDLGCQYPEAYHVLVESLEKTGDKATLKSVRRKYGQPFGDVGVEAEIDVPAWVSALSCNNFEAMASVVWEEEEVSPALEALEIFLESAVGEPSSSQKISLNQDQAVPEWDQLLESHPPSEQLEILKAIYFVIQKYARRNEKGMTALQNRYRQQIIELISEVPEANLVHLMLLPLQKLSSERLTSAVRLTLQREAQPGKALALAHLELNHFVPNRQLEPFIDEHLQLESQNPLLLLAKASLYPPKSKDYQNYHQQGFELARRLQDAVALQAYREEDWFKAQALTSEMMGQRMGRLDQFDERDMLEILRKIAKNILGEDVPLDTLEKLIPILENQMPHDFDDEGFDFDDEEFEPFLLPPLETRKAKKKKRKRWFEL